VELVFAHRDYPYYLITDNLSAPLQIHKAFYHKTLFEALHVPLPSIPPNVDNKVVTAIGK